MVGVKACTRIYFVFRFIMFSLLSTTVFGEERREILYSRFAHF